MDEIETENERLRDVLTQIEQWIAAYPETVFIPVSADQMQLAAQVLREAGISMDAMHAGWARQILDGLREIIRHETQEAQLWPAQMSGASLSRASSHDPLALPALSSGQAA